jgi:hypothetical protein
MSGSGDIVLGAQVWPAYVGFSTGEPGAGPQPDNEPAFNADYERGQIAWTALPNGELTGRASVWVPGGLTFTHMLYLYGPGSLPMMVGNRKLPHPVMLTARGNIEVDPIVYGDWILKDATC